MTHCQTLINNLRENGYRITPQREMIIETLAHSESHLSAEEIFVALQKRTRTLNIATIYRTLDLLVEEGIACRNDLGSGRVVYATTQHGPHIHLMCRYCGNVIDADYPLIAPLRDQLDDLYGFAADLFHVSLSGVCIDCKKG